METKKSWDEFIARQVQAVLAGEFVLSTAYGDSHGMYRNAGIVGPKDGMVWLYGFGFAPPDYLNRYVAGHWFWTKERWYVNLTQRKVLDVVYM